MRIEHAWQGKLPAPVDHIIAWFARNLLALSDRDDASIFDDQGAIPDNATLGINGDEVIDIRDDETRHLVMRLLTYCPTRLV